MELSNITINTYEELRGELNTELTKAATSFVRIGYLLKLARDTDILSETSYADVNDFAATEFGLDKSQVSRFMRINDRFSIGGNSPELLPDYVKFGSAKLAIMLTLPDAINEELSPEYSKSEIEAIKEEYEEEKKISDIEVMIEAKAEQPETSGDEFLALVVKELNDEHPDPINDIHFSVRPLAEKLGVEPGYGDIQECYMPDGDRTYNIRISGQGRFMVTMRSDGIAVVNMRSPEEKSTYSWKEFTEAVLEDEARREFKEQAPPAKKPVEKQKKVEKSTASKSRSTVAKSGVSEKKTEEKQEEHPDTADETADPEKDSDAAADVEKVEGETVENHTDNAPQDSDATKGDEYTMLETLMTLVGSTEIIKVREYIDNMGPYHSYRDELDKVSEWVAQLHTITNNLYAKLASRGQ